ncbi:chromate transporter [Amedibacillus sp. YH-ame6]
MNKKGFALYIWLFRTNFFISAFTFGGGYVVIPMIRKYYVEKAHCFKEDELMEMAAIAQSSPGAIAINLSVLAGYKVAGLKGSILSAFAAVLPPLLILSVISVGYEAFRDNIYISMALKGMQAGVVALIVDFMIDMCATIFKEQPRSIYVLVPITFIASFIFQINVALILIVSVLYCIAIQYWHRQRGIV